MDALPSHSSPTTSCIVISTKYPWGTYTIQEQKIDAPFAIRESTFALLYHPADITHLSSSAAILPKMISTFDSARCGSSFATLSEISRFYRSLCLSVSQQDTLNQYPDGKWKAPTHMLPYLGHRNYPRLPPFG